MNSSVDAQAVIRFLTIRLSNVLVELSILEAKCELLERQLNQEKEGE